MAMPNFEHDEIRGNSKLFGLPGGSFYWQDDNGVSYGMENYIKSCGKSPWQSKADSQDLYLMTDTRNEFVTPANEKGPWLTWFAQNHSSIQN